MRFRLLSIFVASAHCEVNLWLRSLCLRSPVTANSLRRFPACDGHKRSLRASKLDNRSSSTGTCNFYTMWKRPAVHAMRWYKAIFLRPTGCVDSRVTLTVSLIISSLCLLVPQGLLSQSNRNVSDVCCRLEQLGMCIQCTGGDMARNPPLRKGKCDMEGFVYR